MRWVVVMRRHFRRLLANFSGTLNCVRNRCKHEIHSNTHAHTRSMGGRPEYTHRSRLLWARAHKPEPRRVHSMRRVNCAIAIFVFRVVCYRLCCWLVPLSLTDGCAYAFFRSSNTRAGCACMCAAANQVRLSPLPPWYTSCSRMCDAAHSYYDSATHSGACV